MFSFFLNLLPGSAYTAKLNPYAYFREIIRKSGRDGNHILVTQKLNDMEFCLTLLNDPTFKIKECCTLLKKHTAIQIECIEMLAFAAQLKRMIDKREHENLSEVIIFIQEYTDENTSKHFDYPTAELSLIIIKDAIHALKTEYAQDPEFANVQQLENIEFIELLKQLKTHLTHVKNTLIEYESVYHSISLT